MPDDRHPPAGATDQAPPLPPRASRSQRREVWLGLFVLVGIVLTLVLLFALTEPAFFRGRYIISTFVPDAGGIRRGDPVRMRGVNIGRVQRFRISDQGVEVRLEIEGEFDIPVDSKVVITSVGLLQGMAAEVLPGVSKEHIRQGGTLPGQTEAGAFQSAEGLAQKADVVLKRAQDLLSETTIENVQASSSDLRSTLQQLSALAAEERRDLRDLSARLRRSSEGLERITASAERATDGVERATAGPELERSVKRVDAMTQRLDQTTASLDRSTRSLEAVLTRIERGEGTLGKLTREDELYVNLNQAALNLSRLAEDVRKQPKRYVKLSLF